MFSKEKEKEFSLSRILHGLFCPLLLCLHPPGTLRSGCRHLSLAAQIASSTRLIVSVLCSHPGGVLDCFSSKNRTSTESSSFCLCIRSTGKLRGFTRSTCEGFFRISTRPQPTIPSLSALISNIFLFSGTSTGERRVITNSCLVCLSWGSVD